MSDCFFREVAPQFECGGRLQRCHLIPKQRLKREFPHGALVVVGEPSVAAAASVPLLPLVRELTVAQRPGELLVVFRSLGTIEWDERCWVPGCVDHHQRLDGRAFHLLRSDLPEAAEEFAAEYGIGWMLDADFGERP